MKFYRKRINYNSNEPSITQPHLALSLPLSSSFSKQSHVEIAKLSSSRPVLVKLNWDCLNIIVTPPTPPTRTSISEQLIDYLGSWNLEWKLHSTKLGELDNYLATS